MSTPVYMAADRVFASRFGMEDHDNALSDEELLALFGSNKLSVVLLDPSFVSEVSPVSLDRRSDRHKMAMAKFSSLAGSDGFGSWCIAPHLGVCRLYAWAIDSGSLEAVRLNEMISSGLEIEKVSSQTLLLDLPNALTDTSLFLRINCSKNSIQFALMLKSHWVFARRVDLLTDSPLEAVQSTLLHLKSQLYLDDSMSLSWQLIANDNIREELSPLWSGEGACLPLPCSDSNSDESTSKLDYFNYVRMGRQSRLPKYVSSIRWAASAVSLVLLSYLIPAILLDIEAPKRLQAFVPEVEDVLLEKRYWQISLLSARKNLYPKDVSDQLRKILALTEQEQDLALASFSSGSLQEINLRFSIENEVVDPVDRLHLQKKLEIHLEKLLPQYEVKSFSGWQLAVGVTQKNPTIEVVLGTRHDEG